MADIKDIIGNIRSLVRDVSEAKFLKELSDVLTNSGANFDFKDKANQSRLKDVFAKRFDYICDTENDYMYNFSELNKGWIKLSQSIASLAGETYLSFLYPKVKNRISQTGKRRLENYPDPSHLLLMESGTTLWPIDEIEEAIDEAIKNEKNRLFVTVFDSVDSYKERALTPRELYRLLDQRRVDDSIKHVDDRIKPTISKLKTLVSTRWSMSGSFPVILFSKLVEILQYYFDTGSENNFSQVASDYPRFSELVKNFLNKLPDCYIDDVYNLYAQSLQITVDSDQKDPISLYKLLFKWIDNDFSDIKAQMEALALLIFKLSPSNVVKLDPLNSLYTQKPSMAIFYKERLIECIDTLKRCNPKEYKDISTGLDELKQMLQVPNITDETPIITDEAIGKLKQICRHRWNHIKSSDATYLHDWCKEQSTNKQWIYTLQLLKGAGRITGSIYMVLMPDLVSDIEPILGRSIDYYPLSYYVLSQDKKSLICLYNSEKMYLTTGTFYNCDAQVRVPFTKAQLNFIHDFADNRFKAMADEARSELKNSPISYTTVQMLRQLVNNSLFENSLVAQRELPSEQQTRAEKAWNIFIRKQLNALLPEEKNNLLSHSVIRDGVLRTVKQLIDELQGKGNGNKYDACVGRVTSFIARLVCDYDTTNYFDSPIEISPIVGAKSMRYESAFCVFSEQAHITEDVASHRIKLLMIALMTNKFSARSELKNLSWWDINSFGGNDKTYQLGEIIKQWIQNNGKHARHVYANIMECVVKPHLLGKSIDQFKKSIVDNRLRWNVDELFILILNEELFSSVNGFIQVSYYDYKLVFSCFLSLYASTSGDILVRNFLDELVNTCAEDVSELEKIIRINILLNRLFHVASVEQYQQICTLFAKSTNPVEEAIFYELIYDFLGDRVLESRNSASWLLSWSLFKYSAPDELSVSYFSKRKPSKFSSFGSVREVIDKFVSILPESMSSDDILLEPLKLISSSVENARGASSIGLRRG